MENQNSDTSDRPLPLRDDNVPEEINLEAVKGRLNRLWTQSNQYSLDGLPDEKIGKYQLQQIVGAGSFGVVYLARDTETGRSVALKLPRLEVLLDAEKRKRFSREAALMSKLDHPGIARVYEYQVEGKQPYIASAFCDGQNLAQWLTSQRQPVPWKIAARLVAEIADAVDYAHDCGVLHRDLKPANILLESSPDTDPDHGQLESTVGDFPFTPKLTDFGLAKLSGIEAVDTQSSQIIGTPLYMAPERLEQGEGTEAADVYSLGVILFELLANRLPINGDSYLELLKTIPRQTPQRVRSIRTKVPADLDRVCAKCLEKAPSARYPSAGDLAEDLRRCINQQPIDGRSPTWPARMAYWCARPERITDAGWFAIISHLVLITWAAAAVTLLPLQFEFSEFQWSKQISQMLYGICFSFSPMVLLGWLVLKGQRWAIYLCFVITLLKIPAQIRAMTSKPVYFSDLYETGGVYVFMDHFILVVLLMFQLFALGCAIAADQKRRAKPPANRTTTP